MPGPPGKGGIGIPRPPGGGIMPCGRLPGRGIPGIGGIPGMPKGGGGTPILEVSWIVKGGEMDSGTTHHQGMRRVVVGERRGFDRAWGWMRTGLLRRRRM
jgi:hypothetical protein